MKLEQCEIGWRVECRPEYEMAFEFANLHEAENCMDWLDSGLVPAKVLRRIARRRQRQVRLQARTLRGESR